MRHRLLIALLAASAFAACHHGTDQPFQLTGEAQGTYYSIIYYDSLGRDLSGQVKPFLDAFDSTASLWVEQSLIRRVNSNATDTVNPLFADLFQKSDSIRRYTRGAFDCRVGRLVQAWGFSFRQREEPDPATLDSLLHSAHSRVWLDTADTRDIRIRKEDPATELDFNAIAQGASVDLMAQWFEEEFGIHNFLIDIGGEVVAKGHKPSGEAWRVGIERPAAGPYDQPELETAIRLEDASVVTSGNYRKFYERDGVRYSHTIDPATGQPVQHSLLSVSVVSHTAWYADALATAFMVMGLEKSLQFIADHPENPDIQAVFFIYDNGGGEYRTLATPAFEGLRIEN